MRWFIIIFLVVFVSTAAHAQTETPDAIAATHTPTASPTPEPFVYMTMVPEETDEPGQMTRFDYTSTAGDVQIASLLTAQLLSQWAMFLFIVLVMVGNFPTGKK